MKPKRTTPTRDEMLTLFDTFRIPLTELNLLRFRGIRFSIIDFLDTMEIDEEAVISCKQVTMFNLTQARKRLLPSGKRFTIESIVNTGTYKIKRIC